MDRDLKLILAAKAGYEQALRNAGFDPFGDHCWDRQSAACRDGWVEIVKVVEAMLTGSDE